MDIQTRKIAFVQEFLKLQNEEIITGLEDLLRNKRIELYESKLSPMSLEQFNSEIDQAMKDSVEGRLTPASELIKKIQKWD
jgi:hypothetical protein